jgi:dienelactone hydrolase
MKLWVYLPDPLPAGRMPCILIAPAGSKMVHGMALGDGDRAEHVPYVRKGFAVLSYEMDGDLPENPSEAQFATAIMAFRKADWGLANAKAAIDYAGARAPQIDMARVYSVGHSSAGTVSLQIAAKEPRIAACVAFAPVCSTTDWLNKLRVKRALENLQRGIWKELEDASPDRNTENLKCPTMLFTAEDDSIVPSANVVAYAGQLQKTNNQVKLVTVKSGGHYDSMIKQGIPAAITWLQGLKPAKEATAKNESADESDKLAQALIKATPAKQAQLIDEYKEAKGVDYTVALGKAIPKLAVGMKDKARLAIVERLETKTIKTIVQYLEDEDRELRLAAATAAGRKGKDEIAPDHLIKLLKDRDSEVASAAHEALKTLSGKSFAKEPAAWEAWWKAKNKP